MAWYEGINLDAIRTLRDGSKWITDPDHIQCRQDLAHSLIQYAPVHSFVAGERVPQPEEIPVEGEGEEEADTPPESATVIAAESAAQDAATETPASPSAQKTSDAAA